MVSKPYHFDSGRLVSPITLILGALGVSDQPTRRESRLQCLL